MTVVAVDMEMDQDRRKTLEIIRNFGSPRLERSEPHIHIGCRGGIESVLEKIINILSILQQRSK